MRRIFTSFLALTLFGGLFVTLAPSADAGSAACTGEQVRVRGRVTDAATGLPLDETTSVEYYEPDGTPIDGDGTDGTSRWAECFDPGTQIKIKFVADHYRAEWWDDAPGQGSATTITVPGPGPIVANAALTPKGRVIAGRVTNANGVPKFGSVNIWRLVGGVWKNIDGIASDAHTGWYEFVVPATGRYRVHADVDHHKSRFATSATHLSAGRVVIVGNATVFVNDVHVRVPYCPGPSASFCIPPGFTT
jgi:hypothetical protein